MTALTATTAGALLCLTSLTLGAPLFSSWRFSPFRRHSVGLKPLHQQPAARFSPSLQGFSNIFEGPSRTGQQRGQFPALSRTSWGSYPFGEAREQPLTPVRGPRQSAGLGDSYPAASNKSRAPRRRALPAAVAGRSAAPLYRRSLYRDGYEQVTRPAPGHLYRGIHMVPRAQLSDAELHGMACVSTTALEELIRAAHQDRTDVATTPDGKVTTHRTILAGKHGNTAHSTRVASDGSTTRVETVTNTSTATQKHQQSSERTAAGLVQTSAGSVFDKGDPGSPSHATVVTRSHTDGGNSMSRATASGYSREERVPTRSSSETSSSTQRSAGADGEPGSAVEQAGAPLADPVVQADAEEKQQNAKQTEDE